MFEEDHCGIPRAEKTRFQSVMAVMLPQRKAPSFLRELVLRVWINGTCGFSLLVCFPCL